MKVFIEVLSLVLLYVSETPRDQTLDVFNLCVTFDQKLEQSISRRYYLQISCYFTAHIPICICQRRMKELIPACNIHFVTYHSVTLPWRNWRYLIFDGFHEVTLRYTTKWCL